jgi:hypothetical protein
MREREVDDVFAETTGGAAPDYQFGKVTGLAYDLLVITETTESPVVCCGYCSAGMACVVARAGITTTMSSAAHPIRSAGGRPHDNGSRASELREGAKRAHGVELDALAVAEIPERLRAGYAVVVNLDYADLPGWLKTQGGSFGHSCTLYGWKEDGDLVGYFDPLYGQDVRGAWCPWPSIKPALWSDGEHSSTTVKRPVDEPDQPPEPECPDCPPPEVHDDAQLAADLARAELVAAETALMDRDRAWRWHTGSSQPRYNGLWSAAPDELAQGAMWQRFARWGPAVEPGTWNGPAAVWDDLTWQDGA